MSLLLSAVIAVVVVIICLVVAQWCRGWDTTPWVDREGFKQPTLDRARLSAEDGPEVPVARQGVQVSV